MVSSAIDDCIATRFCRPVSESTSTAPRVTLSMSRIVIAAAAVRMLTTNIGSSTHQCSVTASVSKISAVTVTKMTVVIAAVTVSLRVQITPMN